MTERMIEYEELSDKVRILYLYQLELEKGIRKLSESKRALYEQVERLELMESQLSTATQQVSISGNETNFSFGESPTLKSILIPVLYKPLKTGYELTKDLPIVIGESLAERYRIERIISSSSHSTILDCADFHQKINVCVKVILNDKAAFDRGLNEIKIMKFLKKDSNLHSYHIVNVLDYFYFKVQVIQEHLFIVYELLGDSLETALNEDLVAYKGSIQSIAKQLASALQFIHSKGIVYGNMAPKNILLVNRVIPKQIEIRLIGFSSSFTQDENSCSHMNSLPPEQFHSPRGDVWALGCVLAQLYIGRPLDVHEFQSINVHEVKHKSQVLADIIDRSVDSIAFAQFLKRLLEIDLNKRILVHEILNHPWLSNS